MPSLQRYILIASSIGLLLVSACSNQQSESSTSTTNRPVSPTSPAATDSQAATRSEPNHPSKNLAVATTSHQNPQKGGQVLEVGDYHLELLATPENEGMHMDLYLLQGATHTSVPNATVKAQVQLPNGSQQTLSMIYNSSESHYKAHLDTKATGTYKVTILTDIHGNKINGRFAFKQ